MRRLLRAVIAARRLLALALLPLLQWALGLYQMQGVRTVGTYDCAYYYTMARTLALGRGLTDTILWQFLSPPATVVHPAGDYWDIGWPLVLGLLMRIFGDAQHTAFLICIGLSGLVPLLVYRVAHLALRRAGPAWVAALITVLQTRLVPLYISPDVSVMYAIACLAGLAMALECRERDVSPRRLVEVGAVIVLPMFVRGEGFVVGMAALPFILFPGTRSLRENARRTALVVLGMALLALPFLARNRVEFGHLVPPARSVRLWMTDYNQLYVFGPLPSREAFWAQGLKRLAQVRLDLIKSHLELLKLEIPWPILPLAALGTVALAWTRRPRAWALPAFAVLTLLVPLLLVPLISSRTRFVQNVLPVLCILATSGIFAVRSLVGRLLASRVVGALVVSAGIAACVLVFVGKRTFPTYLAEKLVEFRDSPPSLTDTRRLAPLALKPTTVVVTEDPWRVAAVLDVATVYTPYNGPDALDALLQKYRPRYALVPKNAFTAIGKLPASKRWKLREVASMSDATWYEIGGYGRP